MLESEVTKTDIILGDDVTTEISFGFRIDDLSELGFEVSDGVNAPVEWVIPTHFTVTSDLGDDKGGTIQLVDPFPTGYSGVLYRKVSITQETDYGNQENHKLDQFELDFDKIYKILLWVREELQRALQVAKTDTDSDLDDIIAQLLAVEAVLASMQTIEDNVESIYADILNLASGFTLGTVKEISSDYTATSTDNGFLLDVDTSGGDVTITLPLISGETLPFVLSVKKQSDDANSVIVQRNGTDTIDGGTSTITMAVQGESYTFNADDTPSPDNWVSRNNGLRVGDIVVDEWTLAGGDWTSDVTTSLTLSIDPGSENNVRLFYDGVYQHHSEYSVSGTTLTLTEPIPSGVRKIEAVLGQEIPNGTIPTGSIVQGQLSSGLQDLIAFWETEPDATGEFIMSGTTFDDLQPSALLRESGNFVFIAGFFRHEDLSGIVRRQLYESTEAADERLWEENLTGKVYELRTRNDANSLGEVALRVTRGTGQVITGTRIVNGPFEVVEQAYHPTITDLGDTGALSWDSATEPEAEILEPTGNITLTINNAVKGYKLSLYFHQDATTARTITWPSTVKWPGGTAPDLSTLDSNHRIKLECVQTSPSVIWLGSFAENYS